MSLSNDPSREAGSLSCCRPNPHAVFNQRFEALFPGSGALGCPVCFAPRRLSGLSVRECGAAGSASGQTACPIRPTLRPSRSRHGNSSPLHPGVLSPPLLPVWMNVYFFISLVSDFLAVQFSISSGCARRRSVSTYAAILVLYVVSLLQ